MAAPELERVADPATDPLSGGKPLGAKAPGDPGVWVFITADSSMFGLFFATFIAARRDEVGLFEQSRRLLDPMLGLLDTVFLLSSSCFMVFAVAAARRQDRPGITRNLALAMLLGSGFAVSKVIEYAHKIEAGITMLTNDFFMYYFVFTGIHFLHFLLGMGVLGVTLAKSRRDALDARFLNWIESAGCYWHMVDMLWVMLFPLLYLLRV